MQVIIFYQLSIEAQHLCIDEYTVNTFIISEFILFYFIFLFNISIVYNNEN